jgi:SAM-dependent methyltransferase
VASERAGDPPSKSSGSFRALVRSCLWSRCGVIGPIPRAGGAMLGSTASRPMIKDFSDSLTSSALEVVHSSHLDRTPAQEDPVTRTVRQRALRRVVGQFMEPHGLGGYLAGWVMAHRSSNRRRNRWVVSLLDVQPSDRVLEIGFGPGIAVGELSRLVNRGFVMGVDHSQVMLRLARRRNASAVRTGRVDLRLGSVEALPDFGVALDKVVAVNSMGFWPEPQNRLTELRERLRPGGSIAIASQPRCPGATRETSERAAREIEAALLRAGFCRPHVERLELSPPVVCVIAFSDEPTAPTG